MLISLAWWLILQEPINLPPPKEPFVLILQIKADKKKFIHKGSKNDFKNN